MTALIRFLYDVIVMPTFTLGFAVAAQFHAKAGDAWRGRRDWRSHFRAQVDALPESRRAAPRLWFHVTSVGEYLQASPLIDALRLANPNLVLVMTYYSPSVRPRIERDDRIAVSGYLPLDARSNMRDLVDMLAPAMLVFSKFDVWANAVFAAHARGVPLALVAATLSPLSMRRLPPVSWLFAPVFQCFAYIGAISEEHARRFRALGIAEDVVRVSGDTRYDTTQAVAERLTRTTPDTLEDILSAGGLRYIIAGSTWPRDDIRLLPALAEVRDGGYIPAHVRIMIAPHEPTAGHVAELRARCSRHGFRPVMLAEIEARGTSPDVGEIVLVDRVGVLARLYRLGDVAYVGEGSIGAEESTM